MTRRSARLALAGLLPVAAGLAGGSAAAQPPPASAYAQLPPMAQVSLSPDGSRAVMLRAIGDTYQVVVAHLDQERMQLLMAADPQQFLFNWCRWANDERIVCSIRSYATVRATQLPGVRFRRYRDGRTVFTRLLAINADGSGQIQLVPPAVTRPGDDLEWNALDQDTVVSWLEDDPRHILIQLRRERPDAPTLYRLDIYRNQLDRVRRAHPLVQRWYADRRGELRLGAGYRDSRPVAFAVRDGRLEELDLTAVQGIRPPAVAGLGDGDELYVFANQGRDTRGLYRIDLASGQVAERLFEDPDYDVDGELHLHRATGEPLVLSYRRETPAEHWFDQDLAKRVAALRAVIPGRPSHVRLVSADAAMNRMILVTGGNDTLRRHFLFDRADGELVDLGADYPQVSRVFEVRSVSYPARDEVVIPAYLTVPDGAGPFPTVILPHGGPWFRDDGAFDYWAQFLASRGYLVLQPNFRGSSGYGDRHLAAGFEQWGLAMQDDLVDGLDWLIESDLADPARVCFVGGSYGGYAALVAAFRVPQRIRCAVSFAGVTDLADLAERWRMFQFGDLSIARVQDGRARDDNSPLQQVERIGVPLLIVHGDVDRSVMIEQSQALAEALESAGKPYRYIEQANGDHYLSLQSHRLEFLEAMEAFLAEHLSPADAPAG